VTDLFDIFCVCSPERFFDYRCTEVRPVRCSRKWPGAVLVPGHATAHFHTFPTSKACLMFGLDFDECTLIWLSIQMYTVDLQVESVELPLKLGCFVKTHHMIHMISPLCKDRRAWANSWVWLDSKQQLSEEILSQEILFMFSVSMSRRAGPTGCQHMFKHKKKSTQPVMWQYGTNFSFQGGCTGSCTGSSTGSYTGCTGKTAMDRVLSEKHTQTDSERRISVVNVCYEMIRVIVNVPFGSISAI